MTVQVMNEGRQLSLGDHLSKAAGLDTGEVTAIATLARQLPVPSILPVVGAGASWDCGVRVAKEIGADLLNAYLANGDYAAHDASLTGDDLADITERIYEKRGAERVVEDLGFPGEKQWRPAARMGEHFCVYCVLARMVREGFLKKAFGFNYDCGAEAGLKAEGFLYGEAIPGQKWVDYARIVADSVTMYETVDQGFLLVKAHGCAARYRELAVANPKDAAEGIVVRRKQLEDWKEHSWSLNEFRTSAEKNVLVLIGFSGQDRKFIVELEQVLTQVYAASPGNGKPRLVAIDLDPSTEAIDQLIATGLGGVPADSGTVTRVCTQGGSATAALLVLLAELIAVGLETELAAQGVTLSEDLAPRLTSLTVTAPTMLRWSFLAGGPTDHAYIQRANLMATEGYVPLTRHTSKAVQLLGARSRLRERLGLTGPEESAKALADHGFIIDAERGGAYMPVGIEQDVLMATCRQGSELEEIRRTLGHPSHLDCILVSGDGSELHGVNLATGQEV
jgi:hypothetical protein